jgi:hypothetical protein
MDMLDTNLLRWVGYKNKDEYEEIMQHPYNKEKYINENFNELEEVYLIRKQHNFPVFQRGGSTNRSFVGERPLSAVKKDRKYTSEQEWEQLYLKHRKSNVLRYSHSNNNEPKKRWEYTIGGL